MNDAADLAICADARLLLLLGASRREAKYKIPRFIYNYIAISALTPRQGYRGGALGAPTMYFVLFR